MGLWLLLAASAAYGADITTAVVDQKVDVVIRGVKYPATIRKDLKSGLTNRILIRVTLSAPQRLVRRAVELTVKYDLWDETYRAVLLVEGSVVSDQVYTQAEQVMTMLENARLPALFALSDAPRGVEVTVTAELLLNPIEKERLDRVCKWVAENSVYTPGSPSGSTAPIGSSASNAIFNSIFEQYASSGSAAVWRTTVTSAPLRLVP
jgi:hypothetical protein